MAAHINSMGGAGFAPGNPSHSAYGAVAAGAPVQGRTGAVEHSPGASPSVGAPPSDLHPTSTAMVPIEAVPVEESAQLIDSEGEPFSPVIVRLPVELDVMVPVRDFRVRNLLSLQSGQVVESQWGNGEDVPVAAGEIPLAWGEFEVIESQLAVRITRLS